MRTAKAKTIFLSILLVMAFVPFCAYADEETPPTPNVVATAPARVIVAESGVEDDSLKSGASQTIWFTLKNTSNQTTAFSVLVTGDFGSQSGPVSFADTNQVFAGDLAPGADTRVEFPVTTKNVNLSSAESVPITLTLQFTPQNGREETNVVQARVPISHEGAVSIAGSGANGQDGVDASPTPSNPVMLYLGAAVICVIMAFLAQYLQRRKG